jgi:hypothetical protein
MAEGASARDIHIFKIKSFKKILNKKIQIIYESKIKQIINELNMK